MGLVFADLVKSGRATTGGAAAACAAGSGAVRGSGVIFGLGGGAPKVCQWLLTRMCCQTFLAECHKFL